MTTHPQPLAPKLPPTPIEAQLTRMHRQFERVGVSTGEPLHDALISTTALARIVDHERRVFSGDVGALRADLGQHIVAVDVAREKIEQAASRFGNAAAELEAHKIAIEAITLADTASYLGRVGLLMARTAALSGGIALVLGVVGGYVLGDRRAFGSQLTLAEQLRQTYGIDTLSAKTWDPLIQLNDPRPFVQKCIRNGYRRVEDGRRVCEVTLAFPPPPTE